MNQTIAISPVKRALGVLAIAFLSMASSCSHLSVTHYDKTTIDTLNGLKPDVSTVYDGFATDPMNTSATGALSAKLKSAVEYEQGKGEGNKDTVSQVQTIESMYQRHLKERTADGKWTTAFVADKKGGILKAIDGAIQTENLKNKRD